MPEGPFGGPRPFVDANFLIVVGFENDENVMDKLLIQHRDEQIDEEFSVILENIENKIFNKILNASEDITQDGLGVRIIDQLEIRINTDRISMSLLVQIASIARDTIDEIIGEEPQTVLHIE